MLQQAEENGKSVCLCLADIDHFKRYNDINGHIAGDTALREVARILVDSSEGHFVARYGGEEFAMVMYGLTRESGWRIAESMRMGAAKHPFPNEIVLPGGKLTISAGLAEFPRDALVAGELIEMADRALYVAKREGRNKVSTEVSDRRRYNRLRVDVQVEIAATSGTFLPAKIVDLSTAGCSLLIKAPFHAGDTATLRIFDSKRSNEVLVTGQVIWLRGQEGEWTSLIGVGFPLVDSGVLVCLRQFLLSAPEPS
jgi:diguanylate cyclase (GGDEF)-like protein